MGDKTCTEGARPRTSRNTEMNVMRRMVRSRNTVVSDLKKLREKIDDTLAYLEARGAEDATQ